MKDLFILTADADALAFMNTLLGRHEALAIRPITFESIRHPMKDAGVIKDGPETARLFKLKCGKALLLWDYHGSGQEKRCSPEDSMKMIENRLDGVSWQDNSGAVVVSFSRTGRVALVFTSFRSNLLLSGAGQTERMGRGLCQKKPYHS